MHETEHRLLVKVGVGDCGVSKILATGLTTHLSSQGVLGEHDLVDGGVVACRAEDWCWDRGWELCCVLCGRCRLAGSLRG